MKPDVEETLPFTMDLMFSLVTRIVTHSHLFLVEAEERDLMNSVMSPGGSEWQKEPYSVCALCSYHEIIITTLLFSRNRLRTPMVEQETVRAVFQIIVAGFPTSTFPPALE